MNAVSFQLRDRLRVDRADLIGRFEQGGPAEALLKGLARSVDRLLRVLAHSSGVDGTMALVVVCVYGRGELFPHSDVDVLILLDGEPSHDSRAKIEHLVGLLWDLGVALGHSVRTVEECRAEAAADVTVLTALLESRLIAGPRNLYAQLSRAVLGVLDRPAYFQAKVLEQRQRYTKYNESPYSLEPNVKESPGGLRDLHVLLWIARATGYGTRWSELARRGLITAEEARLIRNSERRLQQIRAWLHLITNRREDRLVFDVQQAVAVRAGFHATSARRASEVMMQRYYWAAQDVTQMNTIVLQNIELRLFHRADEPAVELDQTFVARSELLDLRTPDALDHDPNGIR